MELALLDGWVRFWYQGKLLPLPADLRRQLNKARQQLRQSRKQNRQLQGENRQLQLRLKAVQAGTIANVISARGDANLRAENRFNLEVISPKLDVAFGAAPTAAGPAVAADPRDGAAVGPSAGSDEICLSIFASSFSQSRAISRPSPG